MKPELENAIRTAKSAREYYQQTLFDLDTVVKSCRTFIAEDEFLHSVVHTDAELAQKPALTCLDCGWTGPWSESRYQFVMFTDLEFRDSNYCPKCGSYVLEAVKSVSSNQIHGL